MPHTQVTEQGSAVTDATGRRFGAYARFGAGIALALLILAVVGFLRAPETTVEAIRDAAARRDTAELARRIDHGALKQSLGRLLLRQMGMAMPDDGGDNRKLMSQFIVAGALVAPLVETLVTPEGIAALLEGQIAAPRVPAPGAAPDQRPPPKIHYAWSGLSTVRGTVMTPAGEALLVLVLRRDGLTWRLAGVETRTVVLLPQK